MSVQTNRKLVPKGYSKYCTHISVSDALTTALAGLASATHATLAHSTKKQAAETESNNRQAGSSSRKAAAGRQTGSTSAMPLREQETEGGFGRLPQQIIADATVAARTRSVRCSWRQQQQTGSIHISVLGTVAH